MADTSDIPTAQGQAERAEMGSRPRFSLIIPAYNEEEFLPRLLDTVDAARDRYRGGRDAVEVIVANNLSTDRTAEIAESRGCHVALVEKRVIGAVRNGGAKAARGQYLCFIDADMQMHPDTFNAMDRVIADSRYVGGTTGVKMERMSPSIALVYASLLPLKWFTGMDGGVVFCRREDFDTIGGYDEDKLYREDVEFLLALRRVGKWRGQKLGHTRHAEAIFSTRKWDELGELKILSMFIRGLFVQFGSKKAIERLARQYWYDVRKTPGE